MSTYVIDSTISISVAAVYPALGTGMGVCWCCGETQSKYTLGSALRRCVCVRDGTAGVGGDWVGGGAGEGVILKTARGRSAVPVPVLTQWSARVKCCDSHADKCKLIPMKSQSRPDRAICTWPCNDFAVCWKQIRSDSYFQRQLHLSDNLAYALSQI